MKAYKFEFKETTLDNPLGQKTDTPIKFKYLQTLRESLILSSGQQGLSTEDLLQSVLITGKIEEAESAGKGYVLLNEKEVEYVKNKINNFRWSFAHKEVAAFTHYVRDLPLTEVDVKA